MPHVNALPVTSQRAPPHGSTTGEAADQAASETAEAINEAYDTVDKDSTS